MNEQKSYTFWVENYPCYDTYPSISEAINAAQTAYDENDEDVLGRDDDIDYVNRFINIGVVEYFDYDYCIEKMLQTIRDKGFCIDYIKDKVNDFLYDFCRDIDIDTIDDPKADEEFTMAYNRSQSEPGDGNFKIAFKDWLNKVIPDVFTARPLRDEYDLKERKWIDGD